METVEITTERIDDIPLLMVQQQKMGIQEVVDRVIQPHGNWQGLSVGWMVSIWLSYILSESDHRMVVLEEWVADRERMLSELSGKEIQAASFADDRLAAILRMLSQEDNWEAIEERLGRQLIQVYQLQKSPIRLDSTSVAVHHPAEEQRLFQYGYSKDHRPDLTQFKVMLATLDPMGMPLATLISSGQAGDESWYIPTIRRSQEILGQGKQLYVGDSKMSALKIRAYLAQSQDYYLVPLPRRHQGNDRLSLHLEAALESKARLQRVYLPANDPSAPPVLWAIGWESTRWRQFEVDKDQQELIEWEERVLLVFRPALAKRERTSLHRRMEQAEKALRKLVPKRTRTEPRWSSLEALRTAAQLLLKEYRVTGLLEVDCSHQEEKRTIRSYRGRPARTETRIRETIAVRRNQPAIRQARRLLGWRLYATNAPVDGLPFEQVVLTYRDAPRIELDFRRLKGRSLGLRPVYTHRDDHTLGLTRLLTLALRVLTLTEFVVREALHRQNEVLIGLYPGQPKRGSARPTTERLLKVFKGIDRVFIQVGDAVLRHITPLKPLQRRILTLLDLPASVYEQLALSEPQIPP